MAFLAPLSDEIVRMFGRPVDGSANQQRDQPYGDGFPRHADLALSDWHFACWRVHMVVAEAHNARLQCPQD